LADIDEKTNFSPYLSFSPFKKYVLLKHVIGISISLICGSNSSAKTVVVHNNMSDIIKVLMFLTSNGGPLDNKVGQTP
jgi:hypothetical protein